MGPDTWHLLLLFPPGPHVRQGSFQTRSRCRGDWIGGSRPESRSSTQQGLPSGSGTRSSRRLRRQVKRLVGSQEVQQWDRSGEVHWLFGTVGRSIGSGVTEGKEERSWAVRRLDPGSNGLRVGPEDSNKGRQGPTEGDGTGYTHPREGEGRGRRRLDRWVGVQLSGDRRDRFHRVSRRSDGAPRPKSVSGRVGERSTLPVPLRDWTLSFDRSPTQDAGTDPL